MATAHNIRIVLVGTLYSGNIGGVARAMKNMGLRHLYLVNPQHFPAERAEWRAAGASDLLASAIQCDSLAQALQDCHFVVATSARKRANALPLLAPTEAIEKVLIEVTSGRQVAILFGREDSGLTNDELNHCHMQVTIPANSDYSSLNLICAVQILCYEIRRQSVKETPRKLKKEAVATHQQMQYFYHHLKETMQHIGFFNGKPSIHNKLLQLFQRARPDQKELQLLHGLMSATQKPTHKPKPKHGKQN